MLLKLQVLGYAKEVPGMLYGQVSLDQVNSSTWINSRRSITSQELGT